MIAESVGERQQFFDPSSTGGDADDWARKLPKETEM
jgi:hypothetical protein